MKILTGKSCIWWQIFLKCDSGFISNYKKVDRAESDNHSVEAETDVTGVNEGYLGYGVGLKRKCTFVDIGLITVPFWTQSIHFWFIWRQCNDCEMYYFIGNDFFVIKIRYTDVRIFLDFKKMRNFKFDLFFLINQIYPF